MAVLDEILAYNKAHAPVRQTHEGSFPARRRLGLITCVDPRLTRFFSTALGIDRGDAAIIRIPGPALSQQPLDLMRAVATTVFVNEVSEILVLAHTDCGVVRSDVGAVTSALNKRGVSRSAIDGDLRAFFALQSSPRQLAIDTAAAIRAQRFLPEGFPVHAAVIDIVTGELELLERGEDHLKALRSGPASPASSGPGGFGESLPGLGIGVSSSLGNSGGPVQFGNSMPSGLGVGGSLPSGAEVSGPMAATPSSLPPSPSNLTSLDISVTAMSNSGLDLRPSMDLRTSAPQPVDVIDFDQAATHPATPRVPEPPPAPPPLARAASKPPKPSRSSTRPQVALSPEMLANLDKVRAFYRTEMPPTVRGEVGRALVTAFEGGAAQGDLVKIVFKPVLESGPKRYKVIDELLAIKEAAGRMDRDSCLAALRQMLD